MEAFDHITLNDIVTNSTLIVKKSVHAGLELYMSINRANREVGGEEGARIISDDADTVTYNVSDDVHDILTIEHLAPGWQPDVTSISMCTIYADIGLSVTSYVTFGSRDRNITYASHTFSEDPHTPGSLPLTTSVEINTACRKVRDLMVVCGVTDHDRRHYLRTTYDGAIVIHYREIPQGDKITINDVIGVFAKFHTTVPVTHDILCRARLEILAKTNSIDCNGVELFEESTDALFGFLQAILPTRVAPMQMQFVELEIPTL